MFLALIEESIQALTYDSDFFVHIAQTPAIETEKEGRAGDRNKER